MLSKSCARATALTLALFAVSCTRFLPWHNEPVGNEVNLSFTLENNLIRVSTVRIDNHPGTFIVSTAAPRTVVDTRFPLSTWRAHALQISEKEIVRIAPARLDLHGVADGIIGADAWHNHAVTIDYNSGLVTYQKDGIKPGLMKLYEFTGEPMVNLVVDGRLVSAVVDTTSPDTLVLPGDNAHRAKARVVVADYDFGDVDVRYANVAKARVGNRLLSKFLVTVDYGRGIVGLWRDPRIGARK